MGRIAIRILLLFFLAGEVFATAKAGFPSIPVPRLYWLVVRSIEYAENGTFGRTYLNYRQPNSAAIGNQTTRVT